MEPSAQVSGSGKPSGQPTAPTVAPDPTTAQLLARYEAGDKLTPAENGKVGAFKARLARMFGKGETKSDAPGNSMVGSVHSVAAEPIDPRLAQRTTEVVLASLNRLSVEIIGNEGRAANAEAKVVDRLVSKATLPKESKELMVETSPAVCEALGINVKNYPVGVFTAAMLGWLTSIGLAVYELRQLRPKEAARPVTSGDGGRFVEQPQVPAQIPTPQRPKGAPPNVMAK